VATPDEIRKRRLEELREFVSDESNASLVAAGVSAVAGAVAWHGGSDHPFTETIDLSNIHMLMVGVKEISKFLRLAGIPVSFSRAIVKDEWAETFFLSLAEVGVLRAENGRLAASLPGAEDPLRWLGGRKLIRAVARYQSVLGALGLTREQLIDQTLEMANLSREKLESAGFRLEEGDGKGWRNLYSRVDPDGFEAYVWFGPGETSFTVAKKVDLPLIGEYTFRLPVSVDPGESVDDVIGKAKATISGWIEEVSRALGELEAASKEIGFTFKELTINQVRDEGWRVTGTWKYSNLPSMDFSVETGKVRELVEEIRTLAIGRNPLTPEVKAKLALSILSERYVSVEKLSRETGASYRDVVKFAKWLGAEYEDGRIWLYGERLRVAAERAVEEGLMHPITAADILSSERIFSQKVYEAVKGVTSGAMDYRLVAARYRVMTTPLQDGLDEIRNYWSERRDPDGVASLASALFNHHSPTQQEEDAIWEILRGILAEMGAEGVLTVGGKLGDRLGPRLSEVYGRAAGDVTGLGEPSGVRGAAVEWDLGDAVAFLEPKIRGGMRRDQWSPRDGWEFGLRSKSNPHVYVSEEAPHWWVSDVSRRSLQDMRSALKLREHTADALAKPFVDVVLKAADGYARETGKTPDLAVEGATGNYRALIGGGEWEIDVETSVGGSVRRISGEVWARAVWRGKTVEFFETPQQLEGFLQQRSRFIFGLAPESEESERERATA